MTSQADSAPATDRSVVIGTAAIGHSDYWAACLIKTLGLTAEDRVVRIGLVHYNDDDGVERLLTALDRALT